jgi:hypothetical protein
MGFQQLEAHATEAPGDLSQHPRGDGRVRRNRRADLQPTGGRAKFAYSLLWIVLLGTIGIIVYAEMAGRVGGMTT